MGNPYVKGNSAIFEFEGMVYRVSLETITPERAQQYIDSSEGNRKSAARNSERYAIDVKARTWALTGEPVLIDSDDQLIDGHGRLLAIISAGEPITVFVIRGIDPAVRMYIDTVKSRNLIDVLDDEFEVPNLATFAYIAKRAALIKKGSTVSSDTLTTRNEEMEIARSGAKDMLAASRFIHKTLQKKQRQNLMAFLFWAYTSSKKNVDKLTSFIETLGSYGKLGYHMDPANPIDQLAKVFDHGKYSGGKTWRDHEQRLAIAAINMWLSGRRGKIAPVVTQELLGTDITLDGEEKSKTRRKQAKAASVGK